MPRAQFILLIEPDDDSRVMFAEYVVRPDQYLLPTREEAVAQAVTRAKRRRVRAWLTTDEGYDFVLLEEFPGFESL